MYVTPLYFFLSFLLKTVQLKLLLVLQLGWEILEAHFRIFVDDDDDDDDDNNNDDDDLMMMMMMI